MMAVQHVRPEGSEVSPLHEAILYPGDHAGGQKQRGHDASERCCSARPRELINHVLDFLFESPVGDEKIRTYFCYDRDTWGRSAAHYLFHAPFLIPHIGRLLPWRQKDKKGQTPLFALCRSYDHASYHEMVEEDWTWRPGTQEDGQRLHLDYHVDAKGNTLLHIINDAKLAVQILQQCDADVNATNDKKFTPLMVASKYGRFEMVRALFADPRVDISAKELRGLTAVELAKG